VRSSRRRERSSLRRERSLIRRRLATPPPDYLSGPFGDPDDRGPLGADDASGAASRRPGQRRTRLRLALAALPLAVAAALFAGTGPLGGPAPVPVRDATVAEGPRPTGAPRVPDLMPGAADARVPQAAADTAAVAGTVPGQDSTVTATGQDGAGGVLDGIDPEGPGDSGTGADASIVPTAPAGHRPVALRIADPAALSLVAVGDRVDVVGMDGSVLADHLDVLQDRSSGTGSVLVLAAPDGVSAALAAAALSREVTVILSGEPTVRESAP
jgi:hypothetical protein